MKPRPQDIIAFGPWPGGVNNVAREDSLAPSELRAAENVDILRGGKIRSRAGYELLAAATVEIRSLWGDGDDLLFADGAELKSLDEDENVATVFSELHATNPVCFERLLNYVYFSDGVQLRRLDTITGAVVRATPEAPNGAANAATVAGVGGLGAGLVQIAVTFVAATGEESAAGDTVAVTTVEGDGIQLTSLPQPSDVAITAVRVYATDPNEPIFYQRYSLPVGVTSLAFTRQAQGRRLTTQFTQPMPAGHLLAAFAGRLFTAAGNYIYFSETGLFGLTRLDTHSIGYPKPVDMLAPVGEADAMAGLFVGAGARTYFLAGAEPDKFTNKIAYPHGVVPGSMSMVPAAAFDPRLELGTDFVPVWLAKNGVFCIGTLAGRVIPMTEGRVVTDLYDRAASIFRDVEGARQYMVSAPPGASSSARASDVLTVTVVRNGVESEF